MTGGPPGRRPAVVFLLPVWGDRFVSQFLDLSLRTLLAPGNVPAVAGECHCIFRILTASDGQAHFLGHPMFELLSRQCEIEFVDIDDLVCPGVHSLTITLAYVRGMRASGAAMTRTHFVFLVADYVMADGSLAHVLGHIRDGASGVTAGNFQIVKEEADPIVRGLVRDAWSPLSVTPRALVRLAFDHLHPVVLASMPQGAEHTMICNRLFWRAGPGTLVARFYLRHMLCIRPETGSFEVGSSCDYSFIPEMCPSGRVVALADSDDYCVVEMQPRLHEREFIVPGALTPRRLAGYLGDWTTADHRANAHTPVVFHGGEISSDVASVVTESEAYIRKVARHLPAVPQPHRGHPYWHAARSAAADFAERQRRFGVRASFTLTLPEDPAVAGDAGGVRVARARRLYARAVRRGLVKFPWHPLWLDSRREAPFVLDALRQPTGLVIAEHPTAGTDWIARRAGAGWRFLTPAALGAGAADGDRVGVCLIYLKSVELSSLPQMLQRVRPWLATGARTLVFVDGAWPTDLSTGSVGELAGFVVERSDVAGSLAHTFIGRRWTRIVRRASMTVSRARWASAAFRLSVLAAAALPSNVTRLIAGGRSASPTSAIVTLRDGVVQEARDARV